MRSRTGHTNLAHTDIRPRSDARGEIVVEPAVPHWLSLSLIHCQLVALFLLPRGACKIDHAKGVHRANVWKIKDVQTTATRLSQAIVPAVKVPVTAGTHLDFAEYSVITLECNSPAEVPQAPRGLIGWRGKIATTGLVCAIFRLHQILIRNSTRIGGQACG